MMNILYQKYEQKVVISWVVAFMGRRETFRHTYNHTAVFSCYTEKRLHGACP